jgi:hypothetical protein
MAPMIEEKFNLIAEVLQKQLRNELEDSLTFQIKALESKIEEQLVLKDGLYLKIE